MTRAKRFFARHTIHFLLLYHDTLIFLLTLNTETAEEPAEKAPEPKKQKTTTATKKAAEPKDKSTDGNAEKKKPGRPKGSGSSDKPKKEKKEFRVGQALRKTRSQGTA